MKNLLTLLTCLLLFSCTEKKKVKNDWVKWSLKGDVKSVTSYTYGAIEKNDLKGMDIAVFSNTGFLLGYIVKRHDSIIFQWICKYDAHNNLVEKQTYNTGKLVRRVMNKYDEKDNMLEQITFEKDHDSHTDSLIKSDIHFTYKDSLDGNKVVKSIATRQGKPWYREMDILDDKGNITKMNIHYTWDTNINGNLQISVLKYDTQGNMIEKDCFDADTTLDFRFINKYDNKGNKIENASYRRGDTLEFREVTAYDERGNKIRDIDYHKDSVINWDWRYEYKKFDAAGNWLEQVFYDKGKPKTITERTIEYY